MKEVSYWLLSEELYSVGRGDLFVDLQAELALQDLLLCLRLIDYQSLVLELDVVRGSLLLAFLLEPCESSFLKSLESGLLHRLLKSVFCLLVLLHVF